MKKLANLPLVNLADHMTFELATLERVVEDIIRKKQRLRGSRIFQPLTIFVAQAVKGYQPGIILYEPRNENITDIVEEVASSLWLLTFSYEVKNYSHINGRRIALVISTIDNYDQVLALDQRIKTLGGHLVTIICLTINRDRQAIDQLGQSPVKIICLTPVTPLDLDELYKTLLTQKINADH